MIVTVLWWTSNRLKLAKKTSEKFLCSKSERKGEIQILQVSWLRVNTILKTSTMSIVLTLSKRLHSSFKLLWHALCWPPTQTCERYVQDGNIFFFFSLWEWHFMLISSAPWAFRAKTFCGRQNDVILVIA